MNNDNDNIWLKTDEEKLRSLIADEAKNSSMMIAMLNTLRQMQAKSSFRIALLNQLLEDEFYENTGTEEIHRPKK
jgi:hypothetical protein